MVALSVNAYIMLYILTFVVTFVCVHMNVRQMHVCTCMYASYLWMCILNDVTRAQLQTIGANGCNRTILLFAHLQFDSFHFLWVFRDFQRLGITAQKVLVFGNRCRMELPRWFVVCVIGLRQPGSSPMNRAFHLAKNESVRIRVWVTMLLGSC